MTLTPAPPKATVGTPTSQVETKPDQLTPADRGAEVLARHIEAAQEWGASTQDSLARVLADLISAADENPDLCFADALADAWHRLD